MLCDWAYVCTSLYNNLYSQYTNYTELVGGVTSGLAGGTIFLGTGMGADME